MKRIGAILKEARENQGLSLEEISLRTKIHINKLSAIENNDFENLPAKVFIKGLIRSYARELNVDEKTVVELLNQEFEEQPTQVAPPPATTPPVIEEEENEKRPVGRFQAPNSFFIVVGLSITAVLIAFIYVTVSKIQSYSKEEATPISLEMTQEETQEELSQDEAIPEEIDSSQVTAQKNAPDDTKAATKPKLATEPKPEKKPVEASVKKEAKSLEKKQEEALKKVSEKAQALADQIEPPVKVTTPEETDIEDDSEEANEEVDIEDYKEPIETKFEKREIKPTPQPTKVTTVYSDNKLVIEAIEAVRVEITWSDGKPQVVLMKEKDKKTFVFSNPLTVSINNGGAVNIIFNDKFLGVPGKLNTPITLKYP